MGLRAVVFDYGMVLTGPPDPESHAAMVRITGLPADRFEEIYWSRRHAYDAGQFNGVSYWQAFNRDAGLRLEAGALAELNAWDARMWTTENPATLAWQELLMEQGLLTAILSNIGDAVLASVKREFKWIDRFDVLVWSYQLHTAKPDPAIYRHVLKELGTRPEETLFLDDKQANIDAAHALGMKAIQFSTIERLREDLIAGGFDADLPLPA